MISIDRDKFYTSLVVLLISFSLFTAFYIESNPFKSEKNDKFIEKKESTVLSGDHYYKTRIIPGLSPGNYRITIKPIGENITVSIKSAKESVEIFMRDSTDDKTFEMRIASAVWQGIMIKNPPSFSMSENAKTFKIIYKKVDDNLELPTLVLLGIAGTGGVILAVNKARVYRRRSK